MNQDIKTLLLSILVFMIFIGRRLIIEKIKRPRAEGDAFTGISDSEKIDNAIARLNEVFKEPFSQYMLPKAVTEILSREPDSEYALNLLLQDIAAHCRYKRTAVILKHYPEKDNMPPGRIQKLGSKFLMELHMNNEENLSGVIAVIIHEFCHFFLDESGIALENTIDNEILTDTAAIYFGFGYLLKEGYRPSLHVKDGRDMWFRIGYLDIKGIDYALDAIARLKNN